MKILTSGVLLCVLWQLDLPKLPQLLPVDEVAQDSTLSAVRTRVLAAARSHDARTFMSFVSPQVVVEAVRLEGDEGWQRVDHWLSDAAPEDWASIERPLLLGGAFTTTRGAVDGRREFCVPYPYASFPQHVPDVVLGEARPWVVIDKDVAVHESPSANSPVLGRLTFALVQANGAERRDLKDDNVLWQTIDLPNDKNGYVLATKIWNPSGPHVCFAKENGTWMISAISRFSQP